MDQPLNRYVSVRISEAKASEFSKKAARYGSTSEVLREFIDAFIEDRMVITPPVNAKESLYVTRS